MRSTTTKKRPRKKTSGSSPTATALFLGAGSSAAFGYPVTSRLFPLIRDNLRSGKLFPLSSNPKRERAKMKRLHDHLERLLPSIFAEDVELPWITEVLSLVDHFLVAQQIAAPGFTMDAMRDFRILLEEAVLQVIISGRPQPRDQPELDRLTDWTLCAPETHQAPMTIISTNYDILVESLLFEKIIQHSCFSDAGPDSHYSRLDLGFAWREHATGKYHEQIHRPPPDPWVRILKLHGALNWLNCPLCGFTYVNTTGDIHKEAFRDDKVDYNNTCV
jgi:hypothetical protein